ncbi:alpha-tocopherol transfer protein [Caerostris extrusa]|uniref:Alpha-tocopherol transfer protein n=1 Tax=Caerostris extrusa TaxID=172846 RepID=A0AAV4TUD0_CAEEX|nr:alpha-tocopherol transfer protein [Caerostris extrusa]
MENSCPSEVFKPFQSNIITENCRAIAELELHERVDEIPRCLDTLKEMLRREIDLNPCLDDNFLIGFLRARKFHCQLAFNLLKKYYMAPVTYPSMFKNFTPRSCVNAINSNLHYFLPYRNSDGCAILLSKFGQWNPRTLSCDELLKFNIMCNEMALKNPVTQICGIITIADMKDFSWSHLLQIQISDVRCFVSTLQDCLPMRHKTTHIINHSSIFSVLFTIIKPLLTEKIRNRIYFHDTVHSLHKHISPEILPESLGGKLSNQPNQDFYNSLLNSEESFIARQNYGYLSRRHLSK